MAFGHWMWVVGACASYTHNPRLHPTFSRSSANAVAMRGATHESIDWQLHTATTSHSQHAAHAHTRPSDARGAVDEVVGAVTEPSSRLSVRKLLRYTRRTLLIWSCVIRQLCKVILLRRKFAGQPESKELVAARRALASELCSTLILLGPTFIKIGQLLSTRVDVLPREVIEELSSLQNDVPGFPAKRAKAIIKKELGKPVSELFLTFDSKPLAAASLAQVHRATLLTGEEVVVKVQRENLRELFDVDLFNIRLVAMLADRLDPQTEATTANWKGIADTSGEVLYREIDFTNERLACEEFSRNFAKDPNIKVPGTLPELCSSRVLTMEYCPGVKISDIDALKQQGFDPIRISELLTTSYLEQICRHGFFHCDPHPGNLAVDAGHPQGRLVYYDFGMMERVEPEVKKGFVDLVFAIYENLPREACDALEQMGVLRPGIDRFSIERIATDFLNIFQSTISSENNKWENQMTPEEKKASRRARRQRLGADLFATQAERPFLFPPKFTFVFRAFSTIDGIGKSLNPGRYDLTRISQPYLRELIDLRDGSATKTALFELGRRLGLRPVDIKQVVTQPRQVAQVASTIRRLEDGSLKLRVRSQELERTMERVELRQKMIGAGLGSALLFHIGRSMGGYAQAALTLAAARLALQFRSAWAGMEKLETQRLRFANQGSGAYEENNLF
mmetsp:Transcript_33327/g.82994  ORF Transcript_33327/g.82994 Transcript_33327/m.82994 type:complete len:679 (+) Transcript_33327:215-2251(+)